MRPASLKMQFSSGGVIFKKSGGTSYIALIAVKGGNVWCLPKGLLNKGETPEDGAVREVSEETGLTGRIIGKIGRISYWYFMKDENTKYKKTVDFFLMRHIGGNTADHDTEVDDVKWFPVDEAVNTAAYKGDREILKKAAAMIEGL